MLIFRFFTVITLIFLNGCATSPEKTGSAAALSPPKTELKSDAQKQVDKTSIDPDVLFMLLIAEIAGQRGQFDVALEGYMEAAKRVNDPRFAERAAMIAMYAKDPAKTEEAVSLWLKYDPNNVSARKIAALSALRDGDKQAAVEHLSYLLKADPAGFEKTVLELATAVQQEAKPAIMFDVMEELAEQSPGRADISFIQALLAAQMKDEKLALAKIEQTLKIQPDWDRALIFQAQMLAISGDNAKAKALLTRASAKYPDNPKINKLLAQVLIKSGDYEAARDVYRKLLADNPNDSENQFAYGLVELQLDQDDKAEEIFTKLAQQPEWLSQASFYLGKIEEKRGNSQNALTWFDKVTEMPLVMEASVSTISLLVKAKQFDEATARLESLRTRYPDQKQRIALLQAELYSQQKDYQRAFDVLTKALDESSEDKDLLYTHALMAERVGKMAVLEADLKKILAKNPDNPEALNALGYSLLDKTTRYNEAEKYLKHALVLQPEEPVILDSYGWLQFKLGNLQQALGYLQRAYDKRQEPEITAHLVEVLWAVGRKDEARVLFDKAIKSAPDDEFLLGVQHRILQGSR